VASREDDLGRSTRSLRHMNFGAVFIEANSRHAFTTSGAGELHPAALFCAHEFSHGVLCKMDLRCKSETC